jgi:VWFA-related protein
LVKGIPQSADFELLEDGVRQVVRSVSLVAPGPHQDIAAVPATEGLSRRGGSVSDGTEAGSTVLAVVFERLSPESREAAAKAGLSLLEGSDRDDDLIGVFLLDLSLQTLQTFTNDRERLRTAMQRATESATSFDSINRIGPGAGPTSMPPTVGADSRGGTAATQSEAKGWMRPNVLADFQASLDATFRLYTTQQQGHSSITALTELVRVMGLLPGRKTILYVSDGLVLKAPRGGHGLEHRFARLLGVANRANVSIYPVDAVGLRVHSQEAAVGRAILDSAKNALSSEQGGGGYQIEQGETMSGVFERLARGTGGFVIANTNDLASGFARIESDRRFHYLLSYTPSNQLFAGEYRNIVVRVNRQGVSVRARSGYIADHALFVPPVPIHEAAVTAALTERPLPDRIPFRARVFRLPSPSTPGRLALLVAAPINAMQGSDGEGRSVTDVLVFARVLDAQGHVVRKGSQRYAVPKRNGGEILFFRDPELRPGRYVVEVAVHDALARLTGATRLPLAIDDAPDSAVVISDLVVVQHAEAAQAGHNVDHPLVVSDVLLYPNLGQPVPEAGDQMLNVYFSVRTAKDRALSSLTASVVRDRQTVLTLPVVLGETNAERFVQHVLRVPIGGLAPGDYALVITCSDGANTAIRSTTFTLAPSRAR